MAKRTPAENYAISQKIEILMQEGFEEEQATAIAFRMFRDGELDIIDVDIDKDTQKSAEALRKAKQANAIYQLFKLVMKR
jgi:predicted esterase